MADVEEIKRVLRVYDKVAIAPARVAITGLKDVTKVVAMSPAKLDLATDPGEALSP